MDETDSVLGAHEDPGELLGVGLEATEAEIRAAYLLKVKEFPPDREPQQFERIRDAYEILRDPRRRTARLLFSVDPDAPFTSLLDRRPAERRFTGPRPWLAAIKGK